MKNPRNCQFEKLLKEKRYSSAHQRALRSLQRYPYYVYTPQDCLKIKTIGQGIVDYLTVKMNEDITPMDRILCDRSSDSDSMDELLPIEEEINSQQANSQQANSQQANSQPINSQQSLVDSLQAFPKTSKKSKSKKYVPIYKSAQWAILLVLLKNSNHMFKNEIINESRAFVTCAVWKGMDVLVVRGLVLVTTTRPFRYSLTLQGQALAQNLAITEQKRHLNVDIFADKDVIDQSVIQNAVNALRENYKLTSVPCLSENSTVGSDDDESLAPSPSETLPGIPEKILAESSKIAPNHFPTKLHVSDSSIQHTASEVSLQSTNSSHTPIKIPKNTCKIMVCLDNREVRSRIDRQFFKRELEMKGINVVTRSQSLGDICWIAQPFESNRPIVLDFIVERKTGHDLEASIKDDRYKEQKVS
jgi:hypothetical protein